MFLNFCIKYGITKTWDKRVSVLSAFAVYSTIHKEDKMNDYPNMLNLNNGILNIHDRSFKKRDNNDLSGYYFDSVINVDYDEKAGDCPSFMTYLNHTFNNDQDTITNIIQLGGYLLDTSCAAKKMFMFNGPGGSGKSTLIDTYSMFFVESMDAKNQVTGLSLEELAGSGFDKALLINSRFNPCAETKKGYIDAEEIKKIISGDVIKVRQVYSEAVNFRPKTKIVVACNGLPKFTDTSDGIYRRLCTVEFTNQYKSPSDYARIENPDLRRIYLWDSELMDKIKEEKAAILNLFIDGLIALKANKYEFVDSEASTKALNEFKRDSDTVREFLEDNYEIDVTLTIPLKEIFTEFRYWYMENVQDTKSMKFRSAEMGKRIREVFGIDGGSRHSFYNHDTKRYETTTLYTLKRKVIMPIEGEIVTEAQALQLGIDFNDK
jgi:putative DNA primase/helicase